MTPFTESRSLDALCALIMRDGKGAREMRVRIEMYVCDTNRLVVSNESGSKHK